MARNQRVEIEIDVQVDGQSQLNRLQRNTDQVEDGLQRARRAANSARASFGKLSSGLASGAVAMAAVGGAAIAASAAFFSFVTDVSESVDEIGKLSNQLGVSTESLQSWQLQASEAGVGTAEFNGGMAKLAIGLGNAKQGIGLAKDALAELGSVINKDLVNLDAEDALLGIADGISKIDDPARKSALLAKLFGQSAGPKMAALLNQGAEGLKQFKSEALDAGLIIPEDMIKNAEVFNDTLGRTAQMFKVLKSEAVGTVLPGITKEIESFNDVLGNDVNRAAMLKFFKNLGVQLLDVTKFIKRSFVAGDDFSGLLEDLTPVINGSVIAFKALASTIKVLWNVWQTFAEIGGTALGVLFAHVENVFGLIQNEASGFVDDMSNVGDILKAVFTFDLDGLKTALAERSVITDKIEDDEISFIDSIAKINKAGAEQVKDIIVGNGKDIIAAYTNITTDTNNLVEDANDEEVRLAEEKAAKLLAQQEKINAALLAAQKKFQSESRIISASAAERTAQTSTRQFNVRSAVVSEKMVDLSPTATDEDRLDAAKNVQEEINAAEREAFVKRAAAEIQEYVTHSEGLVQLKMDDGMSELEAKLAISEQISEQQQYYNDQESLLTTEHLISLAEIQKSYDDKQTSDAEAAEDKRIANAKRAADAEVAIQRAKVGAIGTLIGGLSKLTELGARKSKKMAIATKALAIGEASIATYLAATNALATVPFPFNFAAAAGVTAAGIANVASISQQKFDQGGVVGSGVIGGFNGSSFGGDTVTAQVRPGEMLLNGPQQRSLFKQINTPDSSNAGNGVVVNYAPVINGDADPDTIRRALFENRDDMVGIIQDTLQLSEELGRV